MDSSCLQTESGEGNIVQRNFPQSEVALIKNRNRGRVSYIYLDVVQRASPFGSRPGGGERPECGARASWPLRNLTAIKSCVFPMFPRLARAMSAIIPDLHNQYRSDYTWYLSRWRMSTSSTNHLTSRIYPFDTRGSHLHIMPGHESKTRTQLNPTTAHRILSND